MNKRWINTKVEFIWDGSQYVEQSSEGYWYDGEMALCATGASATVDGRDTFLITAEWDTLSVKGRVIDWGGANLHIGYDTDHSSHAIFLGNSGNVNHVLVETVNGIYLNQTNSTIRLGTVDSASGRLDVRGDAGTGYGIATTGDIKIIKNSARLIVGEGTSGGQFGQISWNHTDNTLCLGTEAGGEQTQLQLDGDSNVGINTNPTKNLSVYFSDSNTSITAGHGLSGGADGSGVLIYNGNSTANSYANLDFRAHTADGRIAYQTSGADNTADFRFIMDSTSGILERMCIIGETGNVGIGDITPTHKLEVKAASGQFMVRDDNDAQIFLVSNDNVVMGYETAGKVGIGTASPATLLHLSENTNSNLEIDGSTAGEFRLISINNARNAYEDFKIYGDNVNLNANASGKCGIGTSSPQSPLSISSTVGSSATVGAVNGLTVQNCSGSTNHNSSLGFHYSGDVTVCPVSLGYQITSNAGYTKGDLWFATRDATTASTPTERMRILANGNVGIGDTSPSYKLEITGTFYASGSSANFKKNVTDLAVDSSAIYNLNPVSYNYKKDYENFGYDLAEGKQFGLISEEVAESVPELAIMKDGEPKNVDYQKLSVLLLAEMQKMNKRIKDLECHI